MSFGDVQAGRGLFLFRSLYVRIINLLVNRDSRPCRHNYKTCFIRPYLATINLYLVRFHVSQLRRIIDMKEKKRKRSECAHIEPTAKRVAVESSAKTINVSIASNNDEWGPILGMYFLNGHVCSADPEL